MKRKDERKNQTQRTNDKEVAGGAFFNKKKGLPEESS
jgi:hypothetical protein